MRFGWIAAAAVLVAWVSPASAATWIRYEMEALGTTQALNGNYVPTSPAQAKQIFASFTVLAGTGTVIGGPGQTFMSDGFVYTARDGMLTLTVDGSQSGRLTGQQNFPVNGGGGSSASFSIEYPDPDGIGGLPMMLGSYAVTGGVGGQAFTSNNASSVVTMGSVYRLTVSTGTGYQSLIINAVPEPASWAMMIVGMGMAGGTMRRRRFRQIAHG